MDSYDTKVEEKKRRKDVKNRLQATESALLVCMKTDLLPSLMRELKDEKEKCQQESVAKEKLLKVNSHTTPIL